MADIKTAMRGMIVRLAKQEVNAKVRPLGKRIFELSESWRRQKKMIAELRDELARLSGNAAKGEKISAPPPPELLEKSRISPSHIKAMRARLGISGRQLAELVEADRHTVYDWESGKTAPQGAHRIKLIEIRGLSRTRVRELLEQ